MAVVVDYSIRPFPVLVVDHHEMKRAWAVGRGSMTSPRVDSVEVRYIAYVFVRDEMDGIPKRNLDPNRRVDGVGLFIDEGLSWARDWNGPAADALRATQVLL